MLSRLILFINFLVNIYSRLSVTPTLILEVAAISYRKERNYLTPILLILNKNISILNPPLRRS
jgi:hypothetical protein